MLEKIAHDAVLEIKLSRPPVNALNFELLDLLAKTFEQAPTQGYQGIVFTGGTKVFSGGLDVPYLLTCDAENLRACWSRFFDVARIIAKSPIPVATAIAGHNPAGGCVLSLCSDYRVMAKGPFRLGLNETQVGLTVPFSIQYLMRRLIGVHKAERLIVAGAMIDAQQAFDIGLVDELADAEQTTAQAIKWLNELLKLPRTPMLATRAIARADITEALDGFSSAELDQFVAGWFSETTQKTLRSLFVKK